MENLELNNIYLKNSSPIFKDAPEKESTSIKYPYKKNMAIESLLTGISTSVTLNPIREDSFFKQ